MAYGELKEGFQNFETSNEHVPLKNHLLPYSLINIGICAQCYKYLIRSFGEDSRDNFNFY